MCPLLLSKNRSARVQICIIPEKEECGAVAGKYKKKNPVRRERERERERERKETHKGGGSTMRICFR
jgi:hypothetical protein